MLRRHAAEMFPILADSSLYEFTGGTPPATVDALAELYAWRESRLSPDGAEIWLNWVIRGREPKEAIGYAQATIVPTHADIAWVIGTRWQRHGFASEAALHLVKWLRAQGISVIRACVNPTHEASRKVAHNAGLRITEEICDGEEVWTLANPPESG